MATKNKAMELKHIVRALGSVSNHDQGVYRVTEVEDYVNSYLNAGWELYGTHYLGVGSVPGTYNMMYILVRIQDF